MHRRDLDLARLIGQVLDPPLRKLGVFDLDTFSPAAASCWPAQPSCCRWCSAAGAPRGVS